MQFDTKVTTREDALDAASVGVPLNEDETFSLLFRPSDDNSVAQQAFDKLFVATVNHHINAQLALNDEFVVLFPNGGDLAAGRDLVLEKALAEVVLRAKPTSWDHLPIDHIVECGANDAMQAALVGYQGEDAAKHLLNAAAFFVTAAARVQKEALSKNVGEAMSKVNQCKEATQKNPCFFYGLYEGEAK